MSGLAQIARCTVWIEECVPTDNASQAAALSKSELCLSSGGSRRGGQPLFFYFRFQTVFSRPFQQNRTSKNLLNRTCFGSSLL
jgi:hypothetical protein